MNYTSLRLQNLILAGLLCAFVATPAVAASEAPSFKMYDTNDDGMISMEEYVALGGKEQAFLASDANKDNRLSIDEFVKAGLAKDTQGKSNY